ncbi:MAG: T9SS type A sorting domain-containing protein, partial [Bacteroidales bacterium]|nr:T9SS type A sorting domain-containing protein [Bacteroidales bacterium]
DYTEGEVISIDRSMTILAATAKIDATSGAITWSDIITKVYTIPDAPVIDKQSGNYTLGTEITIATGNADSIFVALGATLDDATDFVKYVADKKVTLTQDTAILAYAMMDGKYSDTVKRAYVAVEPTTNNNPTLTITAAGKNTKVVDTVIFDSVATFTMKADGSNLAEGDDLGKYTIEAEIYTKTAFDNMAFEPDVTKNSYKATDTVAEFLGIWNGEYVVRFFLSDTALKEAGEVEGSLSEIYFNVTNYEEPVDPVQISAKAVGNTEEDGKIIFAKGENIAFDIFVAELPENDTNYKVDVYIWTKEEAENAAGADAIRFEAKDSIRFEAEGIYFNHEYVAKFDLMKYDGRRGEFMNAKNTEITFFVTENPEPEIPAFAVKAAGNTKQGDSIVFADGKVAFDMFVELTEKDTIFELHVTVWDTTDTETYALADVFEAADSVRFVNNYYNGVYQATFELGYKNGREFISAKDTTILFFVTENEAPVENYELTLKAVGATMTADTAAYEGNVVFDIFVKGLGEKDTMTLATTIYTLAEYTDTVKVEPKSVVAAKDSVRFDEKISEGAYVAVVELKRAGVREEIVVEFSTLYFTVKEKTAIEAAELAGVNVYPNPNAGTFNVAVPERARVEIFGLNGAKMMSREVNAGVESFSIDHSGIYFV